MTVEARLPGRFARRVPGDVATEISAAQSAADLYIAEYNVWMHHLVDDKGERLFPKGNRLISHWNLRDELKANYADPRGIEKQRTIIKVMERIVTQTIPVAVIDNPKVDWNPFTNKVTAAPAAEVEENAPAAKTATADGKPDPDVRYAKLWANYAAQKKADPFSPANPTAIDRARTADRRPVQDLAIDVCEVDDARFITPQQVREQVLSMGEEVVGVPVAEMDLEAIEDRLRAVPWVSAAEAYHTLDGILHVRVE